MRNDGLLKFLLWMFKVTGVDPTSKNWFSAILQNITLLSIILLNFLYVLEVVVNWNGVKSLGNLNMYPAVAMMLVKSLILQFNSTTLNRIIKKVKALNRLKTDNNEVKSRLKNAYNVAKLFTISFYGMCFVAITGFAAIPFLTNDTNLYFDAYWFCDKSKNPCFIYHFIWQHYVVFLTFPNVLAFDCLFIYFVMVVYRSIEVLKDGLNELDVGVFDRRQVGDFVNTHNQIFQLIKDLNRFYSKLMLAQSWSSLGGLILSLYMITFEGIPPPVRLLTKFGTLNIIFAFQFLIYCIGGNVILEETRTVSDAAFFIDWWSETKGDLRRALVLIIERSQKVEKITVGGIMDLNLECFVWVLKNSLSVYTLLLTMEKKSNMLKD